MNGVEKICCHQMMVRSGIVRTKIVSLIRMDVEAEALDLAQSLLQRFDIRQIRYELSSATKALKLSRKEYDNRDRDWTNFYIDNLFVRACALAIESYQSWCKRQPQGELMEWKQIREQIDMVQVASKYTELKGNGIVRGRCPVHGGDKQSSFSVYRGTQLGYCFACGWRGDAAQLVMDVEGKSFPDTVVYLKSYIGL